MAYRGLLCEVIGAVDETNQLNDLRRGVRGDLGGAADLFNIVELANLLFDRCKQVQCHVRCRLIGFFDCEINTNLHQK